MMRQFCLILMTGFFFCCSQTAEPEPAISEPEQPQSIDLFNGVNLDGWNAFLVEPAVEKEDVWSVQDGVLI